jgi:hypothetical protein
MPQVCPVGIVGARAAARADNASALEQHHGVNDGRSRRGCLRLGAAASLPCFSLSREHRLGAAAMWRLLLGSRASRGPWQ